MTSKTESPPITVIGAGLAGTEAVYQLIRRGIRLTLCEMRPVAETGAHKTDLFSELVCSNSLGSNMPDRAAGMLKEELRTIGSYVLDTAYKYRVPAGNALAVDREAFAREITRYIKGHSLVTFVNKEIIKLPEEGIVIIATGPLTSPDLMKELEQIVGKKHLFFFDAIAPVVKATSIDMSSGFVSDRHSTEGKGDYINCPLSKEEYYRFVEELCKAEKIPLPGFEKDARKILFSACQPIEEIAATGPDSLRFGPMKPIGLIDPQSSKRPWAVVQLRKDNLLSTLYNLVGFQTNLKYSEQERVLRLIPALKNAKFFRFGQMHRDTYLNSPGVLLPTMQLKSNPNWLLAGQITGVEGYVESAATGLLAGFNTARIIQERAPVYPPPETIMGALVKYITHEGHKEFAPMNANFGLFEDAAHREKSDVRKDRIIAEARKALKNFLALAKTE